MLGRWVQRSYYDCPFSSYNWLTEGEGGGTVQLAKDRSAQGENAVALIRLLRGYDSNLQKECGTTYLTPRAFPSMALEADYTCSLAKMKTPEEQQLVIQFPNQRVSIGNIVPKTDSLSTYCLQNSLHNHSKALQYDRAGAPKFNRKCTGFPNTYS